MTAERIFVAGHRGMVGSALVRALRARGGCELILRTHAELDLRDQAATRRFLLAERPDTVYLAAARVGGILANDTKRADFIADNLGIALNVIEGSLRAGVRRLLFLGSSCIYPRMCPQPMREEHLLSGPLEQTNEPYAIAKIAGLKLVESCNRQHGTAWMSAMPTNLYGTGDSYDLQGSHVLPAMLRKFHEAKLAGNAPVTLWGSGTPRREFLHADDLAEACLLIAERCRPDTAPNDCVNVGSGEEATIAELALLVQEAVGHRGEIRWDETKPDGTPRKLLDSSRLRALGWRPRVALREGLARTYREFLAEREEMAATA